jgi:hypothetical protein
VSITTTVQQEERPDAGSETRDPAGSAMTARDGRRDGVSVRHRSTGGHLLRFGPSAPDPFGHAEGSGRHQVAGLAAITRTTVTRSIGEPSGRRPA